VAAELVLAADSNLSKLFYDCKDYIIGIYHDDMSKDELDEICKVFFFYLSIEIVILQLKSSMTH